MFWVETRSKLRLHSRHGSGVRGACLLRRRSCVVLTRQDAEWKQTRVFQRGVNLICSCSTWTFAVTDTPPSAPIKQLQAEHAAPLAAGNPARRGFTPTLADVIPPTLSSTNRSRRGEAVKVRAR